ncbi:MAG: hypothetical protein HY586_03835 [Candidatus Omnitrophica bacterium]|nr:hypothetical protein [Candidatus Omnitrophota bacterium]
MIELLFLFCFVVMGIGTGSLFLRLIRFQSASFLEEVLISGWLGWGWLGTLSFWLGLSGFWSREFLTALCLFFLIIGLIGCFALIGKFKKTRIENSGHLCLIEWLWILFGVLSLLISGLIAYAPAHSTDELSYHLALPKLFLMAGRIEYLPWHVNSLFPLWTEMLYALGLFWQGETLARLMHVWIGFWGAACVFLLTRELLDDAKQNTPRGIPVLAAVLFLITPGIANQMSFAMNDVSHAVAVLFSFLAFLIFRREKTVANAVVLGMCLGIVLSIKYLGIITYGLTGVLILFEFSGADKKKIGLWVTWIVLGALAIAGGWYLRNWLAVGNPFYPYFQSILGGSGIGSETKMEAYGLGKGLFEFLALPWNVTFHQERFGGWGNQIGPVFLAFLPFFFFIKIRSRRFAYFVLFLIAYVIAWFLIKQNTRFLFPAIPFLAVLVALSVGELSGLSKAFTFSAYGGVSVFLALSLAIGVYHLKDYVPLLLGKQSREEFLKQKLAVYPVARFINQNLPQNAHVLTQEHRGFYFDRTYTRERAWRRLTHYDEKFSTPEDLKAELESQGFTHLLLVEEDSQSDLEVPVLSELAALPSSQELMVHEAYNTEEKRKTRHRLVSL